MKKVAATPARVSQSKREKWNEKRVEFFRALSAGGLSICWLIFQCSWDFFLSLALSCASRLLFSCSTLLPCVVLWMQLHFLCARWLIDLIHHDTGHIDRNVNASKHAVSWERHGLLCRAEVFFSTFYSADFGVCAQFYRTQAIRIYSACGFRTILRLLCVIGQMVCAGRSVVCGCWLKTTSTNIVDAWIGVINQTIASS